MSTPTHSSTPIIEARELTRHYGRLVAVDRIDFSVERGERQDARRLELQARLYF